MFGLSYLLIGGAKPGELDSGDRQMVGIVLFAFFVFVMWLTAHFQFHLKIRRYLGPKRGSCGGANKRGPNDGEAARTAGGTD